MSKRSSLFLLEDILNAINKINVYIDNQDKETFSEDEKSIDAAVRNLEIIGEAANQLPEEFRVKYNSIEWRKIIGLRNRIVHQYFDIDLGIVGR